MIILRTHGEPDRRLPSREVDELNAHLERHVFDIQYADRPGRTRIRPRYIRVFHGDLRSHGRFYARVQSATGAERRTLRMDGEPVVELDIASCQLRIALNSRGLAAPRDAYALPGVPRNQRAKYKQAVVIMMNARDRPQAEFAFAAWLAERGLDHQQVPRVFERIIRAYPGMEDVWFSDASKWCMHLDSEVCAGVFAWSVREDIPVLGVHDAWLAPTWAERELYLAICHSYRDVVGEFDPVLKRTAADGTEEYVDDSYYGL